MVILLCVGLAQMNAQAPSSQSTDSNTKETADKVYRVGDEGVTPPRATYSPSFEFSEAARKAGYEGTCVLWLVVDAKGMPRDITVKQSLGRGLDEKAIEAVRGWRFTPGMKDGVPVAVQINVAVSFHIAAANSKTEETADKIYVAGHGVTPPRAIYSPDPEFSEEARHAGHRGTCVLWLIVDNKGTPRDIMVKRSLGMGLDEKAVETVRQWKFKPAMKDGVPVAVQVSIEISFRLYDGLDDTFVKADAGDANAQFVLSQAFFSDRRLQKDESRGFAYLEKAAKQGLPEAQFAMGDYLSSHGNDLVTAYVWYALAHRNRYQHSDKRMKELAKKMTPDQLTEARRRVDSKNPI